MDGRIQEPIIDFLKTRYHKKYVDAITEPGPNKTLSEGSDKSAIDSIFKRLDISVQRHNSELVAISGHFDCAGNPASKEEQIEQIKKSSEVIKKRYPHIKVVELWVNSEWKVEELGDDP
jgi:ABC-type arginine transport system ATPase subunit